MTIALTVLFACGVLFHLLCREGIPVSENVFAFIGLVGWVFFGVFVFNCVFGTEFGDEAVLVIWFGLFGAWTVAGIWFLIGEYRKRWAQRMYW